MNNVTPKKTLYFPEFPCRDEYCPQSTHLLTPQKLKFHARVLYVCLTTNENQHSLSLYYTCASSAFGLHVQRSTSSPPRAEIYEVIKRARNENLELCHEELNVAQNAKVQAKLDRYFERQNAILITLQQKQILIPLISIIQDYLDAIGLIQAALIPKYHSIVCPSYNNNVKKSEEIIEEVLDQEIPDKEANNVVRPLK